MTNQELKLKAKMAMVSKSGTLAGATFIYGAIYVGVVGVIMYAYSMTLISRGVFNSLESMQTYIDTTSANFGYSLLVEAVSVIIRALLSTFLAGIQYMCLTTLRDGEIKASDVFYAIKRNPDKVIILSLIKALLSFVFAIPVNVMAYMSDNLNESAILSIVYVIFLILSYAFDVVVAVMLSQSVFAYIDNPDGTVISYLETSLALMKNNAGRYIILYVSFIPLNLLALLTMGIMYLWVLPYMWTTFALFYMELKGESKQGSTIDVRIQ